MEEQFDNNRDTRPRGITGLLKILELGRQPLSASDHYIHTQPMNKKGFGEPQHVLGSTSNKCTQFCPDTR